MITTNLQQRAMSDEDKQVALNKKREGESNEN